MTRLLILFCGLFVFLIIAGPIEDIQVNEWYEVPNSRMDAVDPENDPKVNPNHPNTSPWRGVNGISSAIGAWSSGAFDTKRGRLIVWGGGHNDYAGNEIYVFDLNTLQWERVTDPAVTPPPLWTIDSLESTGYYAKVDSPTEPDSQQPRSRHTYEYIEYVPHLDALCSFGAACQYPSGQIFLPLTDCYDFTKKQWIQMANTTSWAKGFSAVDPVTGHAWLHGTNDYDAPVRGALSEYDPVADKFYTRTARNEEFANSWGVTADIDHARRKLIAVGKGSCYEWDISNPSNVTHGPLATTGDTEMIRDLPTGRANEPRSGRRVARAGGQAVSLLGR